MKISTRGRSFCRLPVPIRDDDTPETLSERVLREEHRIYTEAVRIVLEGRYKIEGRRVLLTSAKDPEKK